jgi:hypothetical protein
MAVTSSVSSVVFFNGFVVVVFVLLGSIRRSAEGLDACVNDCEASN